MIKAENLADDFIERWLDMQEVLNCGFIRTDPPVNVLRTMLTKEILEDREELADAFVEIINETPLIDFVRAFVRTKGDTIDDLITGK